VRSDLVATLAARSGGSGMVGGQMIDLESEHAAVDAALIARLETMKTGALIAYSSAAGALLGGAGAEAVNALETFGFELGLAFQITDDLLDVEGDEDDVVVLLVDFWHPDLSICEIEAVRKFWRMNSGV
jgi:geranylgeranyl pyrophosphate synthase